MARKIVLVGPAQEWDEVSPADWLKNQAAS
jgi:hypothetical protein